MLGPCIFIAPFVKTNDIFCIESVRNLQIPLLFFNERAELFREYEMLVNP